jgi:hypothetical protein
VHETCANLPQKHLRSSFVSTVLRRGNILAGGARLLTSREELKANFGNAARGDARPTSRTQIKITIARETGLD